MQNKYLEFKVSVGKQKPESIINPKTKCPFCDRAKLSGIIAQSGDLLLIENKYQVLENAYQTVLIETTECGSDISLYTKKHLHALFDFGIHHWLAMENSKKYKSVLFFKNHGPFSGGTIRHPHMQIVGLHTLDYAPQVNAEHFIGIPVDKKDGVELNLSLRPQVGFTELNIVAGSNAKTSQIADYIQVAAHYLLNGLNSRTNSYNIFFYLIDGLIRVKVMPRFATSPLYIGYQIHLIPDSLEYTAKQLKNIYFAK